MVYKQEDKDTERLFFLRTKLILTNSKKENNLKLSAQISAVIAKAGASANANYANGILIFTQSKGGFMYEVSAGGQTFNYESF